MATRYGHVVLCWLAERGWTAAPLERSVVPGHPEGAIRPGDRHVIDPLTGEKYDVYSAARIHRERTGEYPDALKEQDSGPSPGE